MAIYIYWYILVAGIKRVSKLYMCVYNCARMVYGVIYKFLQESSIHCTGYTLIQVQIESVCKSHYLVLAGIPKLYVDFLAVSGVCGCSWTISSVVASAGAGIGAGAGTSAVSAVSAVSAISVFATSSSFLSAKYRIRHRSICHEDKVGSNFINRIMLDKVSLIIVNEWVLKLSFICFCGSAVSMSCLLDVC